jgi:hypothetical protein
LKLSGEAQRHDHARPEMEQVEPAGQDVPRANEEKGGDHDSLADMSPPHPRDALIEGRDGRDVRQAGTPMQLAGRQVRSGSRLIGGTAGRILAGGRMDRTGAPGAGAGDGGGTGEAMTGARSSIRIGSGQGFWGDRPDAPIEQVRNGPIDYLMMDYLAEVTMSILQKQKSAGPVPGLRPGLRPPHGGAVPRPPGKGVRVVSNAGGVNLEACRDALLEAARRRSDKHGERARIGVVFGDDLLGRLEILVERGHELRHMETGRPLADVLDRVASANAYIGARPIVQALERGATVVVTGRSTDTALTYAPMMHEFGWAPDEWDRWPPAWWRATSTSAAPRPAAATA